MNVAIEIPNETGQALAMRAGSVSRAVLEAYFAFRVAEEESGLCRNFAVRPTRFQILRHLFAPHDTLRNAASPVG